jgi:hypothetical protein
VDQAEAGKVTRLDFEISGSWQTGDRWLGVAKAMQPLVGVVFLDNDQVTDWVKTPHRASEAGLPCHLMVGRYSGRTHLNFGLGPVLLGHWTDKSDNSFPHIPSPILGRTGERTGFTRIKGVPPISLSLLLLTRGDVRSLRTGLWTLRQPALDPLLRLVSHGRTGSFPKLA